MSGFGFGSPFFSLTQLFAFQSELVGVVAGTAEPVGAALGDRRDLQAARPAELGLIALREDLDFGDRLDVHVQHLAVVAGVHRRDAVHHDVVLAGAADARAVWLRAAAARTPGANE